MTRLSPAERARQAKPKVGRQAKANRPSKVDARAVSMRGAERLQVLFDRVFKAQSIYFYRLLGVTLFLVTFGVVMVLSASSIDSLVANDNSLSVFLKQLMFAIIGLTALSLVSLMPVSFIKSRAKFLFAGAVLLQAAVFFVGKEINGNKNWLDFGLFSIQPSEFLKITVILHVSVFLSQQQEYFDDPKVWYRALGMAGLAMGLVLLGRDLGTVIIMVIAFIGLLALAGMPTKLLQQIGIALAIVIPAALMSSSSRRGRINAWLNPNAPDPLNYNWQSEHGMWAISAGRIFGSGLGESKMKWSWIPEVENDFIFAIIAEELGLIGALVVISLFVFLALSLLRILQRTSDPFSRFVVSAVLLWLTFQALINIAVVLRLLPVLGVPLPLISAGGSSLIAALALCSPVISCSTLAAVS
jgi:cell division protein FtsW